MKSAVWRHPGMWSISIQLSLWYAGTILVILTGFAVLTYINFHLSLHRDFDRHLNHEYRILVSQILTEGEFLTFQNPEMIQGGAYSTEGVFGTYVRLIDSERHIVFRSPNFAAHQTLPVAIKGGNELTTISVTWDDNPLRSHYFLLKNANGEKRGWLEVSGFEWSLHQEINRLLRTFTIGILLTGLLALLGGYLLAKRALRPVSEITRAANEIRLSRLSVRIPVKEGVQDEITDLGDTLNRLFARIQDSIDRERRFSASAAHELVTPLATLRAEIDLVLRDQQTAEATKTVLYKSLEDIDRIELVVRSLLLLSSAEQMHDRMHTTIDVSEICVDHINNFSDRAEAENKRLIATISPDLFVHGVATELGNVLDNLLDNAFKYSPEKSEVHLQATSLNGEVIIAVRDQGIGFDADDQEKLFDRFFRARSAEVQKERGSGLGLSIAAATTHAMQGTITGTSAGPGLGSEFVLRFPGVNKPSDSR